MWLNSIGLCLNDLDILDLLSNDRLSWRVGLSLLAGSWARHVVVLNQGKQRLVLVQDMQVSQSGLDELSSQGMDFVVVN